jgi:hypothetical protein
METTHNKHFSFVNISLLLLSFWFLKYCAFSFIDCNNEENKKMHCQSNITRADIAIHLTVLLSKKQWKSTLDWSLYLCNLIMKQTKPVCYYIVLSNNYFSYKSSWNSFVKEKDIFIRNTNLNLSLYKISLNINC